MIISSHYIFDWSQNYEHVTLTTKVDESDEIVCNFYPTSIQIFINNVLVYGGKNKQLNAHIYPNDSIWYKSNNELDS